MAVECLSGGLMRSLIDTRPNHFPSHHELTPEERKAANRKRRMVRGTRYVSPYVAAENPRLARTARQLHYAALDRARVQGVPFTIEARWVLRKLRLGKCEVTGIPFEVGLPDGVRSNFIASIDRNVPALGYTPENTRIVIWGYNAAKSSGTDEDVMRMAEALVRQKTLKDGTPSS